MYKEILVPLDGSEVSASSLPIARQLAKSPGARVHLLQVSSQTEEFAVMRGAEFGTMGADYSQQVLDEVLTAQRDRIERYLDEVGADLESDGLTVVKAVEDGQAADKIVDYAEAAGVDLVIMSTHGRGGVRRFLVGSVTDKVIRSTNLPVLVIHPE
ncbi:MAG: universal stress protein [Chloroflexi bacterium]|nr:universal stress protein [Chloroflexota bacterium]